MTAMILAVALTVPAPALTVADWQAAHERFPRWIPAPPAQEVGPVERWRPLVEEHFPAEHVDRALRVMACESGGNARAANPRSSARGLMQILASLWAPEFGVTWEQLYDPETNIRLARKIWDRQGWEAWVCA